MKKFFLLAALLAGALGFAQSVNNYKYIILQDRFEFQKSTGQYNLNELTKKALEKYGFTVFYVNTQVPEDLALNRCIALYGDVVESGMSQTKLNIVLKDCNGAVIYTSGTGTSRLKDRQKSYYEALREAVASMEGVNYKFEGSTVTVSKPVTKTETVEIYVPAAGASPATATVNENLLFAQPIANGYQLVDSTPKIVLKMYKTSQGDSFTAVSDKGNGVVFRKGNDWFFEYYQNDKLVSEKLNIKF